MTLRAPFPWFGGKSRAAPMIWEALGDVGAYIEPFAGSLATLLARPTHHRGHVETVNDLDRYVCVAPETLVLMRDLTWRPAGDLEPGYAAMARDRIGGVDERCGVATATSPKRGPVQIGLFGDAA